jgi:hypothetical protein
MHTYYSFHAFDLNDDPVLHNDVWTMLSYEMPFVMNGHSYLPSERDPLLGELDTQRLLIRCLHEARPQEPMDFHGATDDPMSQRVVLVGPRAQMPRCVVFRRGRL